MSGSAPEPARARLLRATGAGPLRDLRSRIESLEVAVAEEVGLAAALEEHVRVLEVRLGQGLTAYAEPAASPATPEGSSD